MKNTYFVLTLLVGFAFSCNTKKDNQSIAIKTTTPQENINPPQTIIIANLTDSLQPKTVLLRTRPKPLTIKVPSKTGGSYTTTNASGEETKIMLKPPVEKLLPFLQDVDGKPIKDSMGNHIILGNGGISNFTNYTTDDGLALDEILCSLIDHFGNLWFGTFGGGVSKYDGTSFINYNTSQGLVNNSVNNIFEDRIGNIWIGTDGGVSKYNGKYFTNFTTASGLANNIVQSISEDISGNLWFGTFGGGVSKYDGTLFTNYNSATGLAGNAVYNILEDKERNLWFCTNSGISKYRNGKFSNYNTAHGLVNNIVFSMVEDRNGDLWFGTDGGVSKYDALMARAGGKAFTNYTTAQGLVNNQVRVTIKDKNGNIWFGTKVGVSKYDFNNNRDIGVHEKVFTNFITDQGLINNHVLTITEDRTGNIWFGTVSGLSKYAGNSITNFTTKEGLAHTRVYSSVEDATGTFWFGTFGGGVSKYDGKSFTNFTTEQGLTTIYVNSILKDKNNNLWFGTSGGGVSCYDGRTFTNFTTLQGLVNNIIGCIAEDKIGNIWFGTNDGVSKYDGKSFTNFNTAQGIANNEVNNILEDKWGNLWFATNGGISIYDGKSFTNFTTIQGLTNNNVYSIAEDKSGNLWFGTNGGGVSRISVKQIEKLKLSLNLSSNDLSKLSFENFTTAQGLANDVVYDIVQDHQGNIIIGTNLGFTLIPDKVSSLPFTEIRQDIEYYNSSTGYPVKDVNANSMLCDSKGIIWAGTGNQKTALVRFDYAAIQKSTTPPTLVIQKIKVNEENICWFDLKTKGKFLDHTDSATAILQESMAYGKRLNQNDRDSINKRFENIQFDSISSFYLLPQNLVLPYEHNQITFDFNAIETDKPQLVNYQYILEGYDKSWSPILKNTNATFGNMKEGTYTFKVKARGVNKVWCEPASYSFKVLPPLYRSWWAYTLYMGLLGFVGWRLHIFQKKRTILHEREKVQERELAQAKEIKKAYTELGVVHENLKSTQAHLIQSEKMASLGELTAGIAHEIQNPLNFVNNFSELNSELVKEIKQELTIGNEQLAKGEIEETINHLKNAIEVSHDIEANSEKIKHHGKRAESIVKGMLEHSRKSTGVKEPTDINKLCDEFVRLSYHGLRAKDKDFNCEYKLDLDPNLPLVNVVSQDMGRVLLNILNNAFQACSEKSGSLKLESQKDNKPLVSISTKYVASLRRCELIISDNGPGIPDSIKDKIFQPFFTTKPTGQGTGLGLSLAYDIIKAHGGEISVKSEAGLGAEFIIQIPTL